MLKNVIGRISSMQLAKKEFAKLAESQQKRSYWEPPKPTPQPEQYHKSKRNSLPKSGPRSFTVETSDDTKLTRTLLELAQNSVVPFYYKLDRISHDNSDDHLPAYGLATRMISPESESSFYQTAKLHGAATLIIPCNFTHENRLMTTSIRTFPSSAIGTLNLVDLRKVKPTSNSQITGIAPQDISTSNSQPILNYATYASLFHELASLNDVTKYDEGIAHNEIAVDGTNVLGIVITNLHLLRNSEELLDKLKNKFPDTNLFLYSKGILSIATRHSKNIEYTDISPALPDSVLSQFSLEKYYDLLQDKMLLSVEKEANLLIKNQRSDVQLRNNLDENYRPDGINSSERFPSTILKLFRRKTEEMAKKLRTSEQDKGTQEI